MQTVMAEHCTDTSERVTCPAMKHQIGWHFGHVQRQSGHVYLQNRGLWECVFCTPLYIFSVLTYALIGKKKTNEKTQLSASLHSGVQNQKTQTKTKKKQKNNRNQKKTRKPRRPTGPECLWHRVGFLMFVFFLFCLFFLVFVLFLFSFGFGNLWPTGSSFGS